ncbi:MAG: hypothetical protein PHE96_08265 [Methylococcales bacterium]|nr:hypothetical protein [Methylococcales bacterium]
MSKDKTKEINWLPDVDDHNYPAAESYLTILYSREIVADMIARLKNIGCVRFINLTKMPLFNARLFEH